MKITVLQLSEYGIYRGASWQPSTSSLNVVMGENESGKTTMLRFIRDMLFGYGRGKWQGRKGNMAFVRADGQEYRSFVKRRSVGSRMRAMRNSPRSCRYSGGTVSHALCMSRSSLSA